MKISTMAFHRKNKRFIIEIDYFRIINMFASFLSISQSTADILSFL